MTDERPMPDDLDGLRHVARSDAGPDSTGVTRALKEQDGKYWTLMESGDKPFSDGSHFVWQEVGKDIYDFFKASGNY